MNLQKLGIEELLQKKMDRKDFLKFVGIAAIALTGVSALMKTLLQHSSQPTTQSNNSNTFGYGSMPYGGMKK